MISLCLIIYSSFLTTLWSNHNFLWNSQGLPTFQICQLTGKAAPFDSLAVNIKGTDLGIIFNHNGNNYFLFGDTNGLNDIGGKSNTLAFTTDSTPWNGISLNNWIINSTSGEAKELITSRKINNSEITCIPTTDFQL